MTQQCNVPVQAHIVFT